MPHAFIPRRAPRRALVLGTALVLGLLADGHATASPEAGERGHYRGQCRQLTKQIDHYENTVLPMAYQRRNAAWANATRAQIERLWHRRADLCPAYGKDRTLLRRLAEQTRRFNQMLAAAGRAAAAFFTGGAAGGL
ncbi:MAG: hypothetical protein H6748_05865 [Spirochaetaceae bacterium]|nr:hypothetical protein [Myxococcales bacterium]MCB9723552.1 hypothetical protein [Spirochaetaceae bacterium]HPG26056.1 hypothetical protein [Myxococcota bacterium]